jgi:cobalt transporter subunit CbtB
MIPHDLTIDCLVAPRAIPVASRYRPRIGREIMTHAIHAIRRPAEALRAALPALVAIMFGAFVVYGVGFAGPATIHNAAHDVRHAFAFPCH